MCPVEPLPATVPAGTRRRAASLRNEIAAIKAEHHVSETSAYAMLIQAAVKP
jgi:hypothetical protein